MPRGRYFVVTESLQEEKEEEEEEEGKKKRKKRKRRRRRRGKRDLDCCPLTCSLCNTVYTELIILNYTASSLVLATDRDTQR